MAIIIYIKNTIIAARNICIFSGVPFCAASFGKKGNLRMQGTFNLMTKSIYIVRLAIERNP